MPFYAAACSKIFTTSNAYRYILSILKQHNLRSLRVLLRFKGYLLLTTRIHWIHLYVYFVATKQATSGDFFKKHATAIKAFLVLLQWKQAMFKLCYVMETFNNYQNFETQVLQLWRSRNDSIPENWDLRRAERRKGQHELNGKRDREFKVFDNV